MILRSSVSHADGCDNYVKTILVLCIRQSRSTLRCLGELDKYTLEPLFNEIPYIMNFFMTLCNFQ